MLGMVLKGGGTEPLIATALEDPDKKGDELDRPVLTVFRVLEEELLESPAVTEGIVLDSRNSRDVEAATVELDIPIDAMRVLALTEAKLELDTSSGIELTTVGPEARTGSDASLTDVEVREITLLGRLRVLKASSEWCVLRGV